ncbi:D-amino-acid transaminase [Metabacillus sp. HB246100]|uniref:D-amino-acid transaminase n=1 Tax=Bacillus weihaiensis TaxID=1547283 RepID=UPI002354921D|nr:D-amino-acid transaminase [Bacillus weihaiensis]
MDMIIYNNSIIERDSINIDLEDRGYQFGDGVYEVIRVYNGKLFTAEEHLKRFVKSANEIKINVPYQVGEMQEKINELIHTTSLSTGIVYLQLTRGVSKRNHAFPSPPCEPVYIAYTKELALPIVPMKSGVTTITVEDIRWLRCDIKSLNLLPNILAKQEAVDSNSFEAIQHRGTIVTEGSSSNVWMIKNQVLYTHPANHYILNGITRQVLLSICKKTGFVVEEKPFTIEDMVKADEVFLTGTTTEIMPVIQINKQVIGNGDPGTLTRQLQQLFTSEIEKQCGNLSFD